MATPPSWLLAQAHRTSRNRCIVAALALAAAIAWLASQGPYLREFFRGPTTVTPQRLASLSVNDTKAPHWIRVRADEMLDTGIEEITVRKRRGVETGRSVSGHYYAARVGERFVLVKATGEGRPGLDLVGEIKHTESSVDQRLFSHPRAQALRAQFLPLMVDLHDFRTSGWWLLGLTGAAMLGAGLWGFIALRRMRAPESHPSVVRAAEWGPLPVVSRIVQQEARAPGALRIGGWTLTTNHLLRSQWLSLDLRNLNDLLWAHPQVTKKKLYYVIPAGETHALVLKWRDASVTLPGKKEQVEQALARIAANQPWIMLGWHENIEKLYSRQRAQVAREVQKNRQRWQAGQGAVQQA